MVEWWDRRNAVTSHLQHAIHKQPAPALPNGRLHNPYEGQPGARQLSESIEHFLSRLPPSTTDRRPALDWVRISNPYTPPGPGQAITQFRKGGEERLALFAEFEQMATASGAKTSGRALTALKKEVVDERRETIEDLRDLAGACNIVTGKWMLFPEPESVDEIWAKIAMATANGELGIGAKVETRVQGKKDRLVCVYTSDFRDKDDVARVLNRLGELELVRPSGKQIYYKLGQLETSIFQSGLTHRILDAWTELGIYGGNSWGIGASTVSYSLRPPAQDNVVTDMGSIHRTRYSGISRRLPPVVHKTLDANAEILQQVI